MIKIKNIANRLLIIDGKEVQPGRSVVVNESPRLKYLINNHYFEVVEKIEAERKIEEKKFEEKKHKTKRKYQRKTKKKR